MDKRVSAGILLLGLCILEVYGSYPYDGMKGYPYTYSGFPFNQRIQAHYPVNLPQYKAPGLPQPPKAPLHKIPEPKFEHTPKDVPEPKYNQEPEEINEPKYEVPEIKEPEPKPLPEIKTPDYKAPEIPDTPEYKAPEFKHSEFKPHPEPKFNKDIKHPQVIEEIYPAPKKTFPIPEVEKRPEPKYEAPLPKDIPEAKYPEPLEKNIAEEFPKLELPKRDFHEVPQKPEPEAEYPEPKEVEHKQPIIDAPPIKPSHPDRPYFGKYPGKCHTDGFYYNDPTSMIFCSNGHAYKQPCAPGSRTRGSFEQGKQYSRANFCNEIHGY